MIHKNQALSMAESLEYVGGAEGENTDIIGFIKKFSTLKPKEAKEIRQKIEELKLLKVKQENIAKIIDLLPENSADLNKIFEDVSLDEDEANKILDILKQYK